MRKLLILLLSTWLAFGEKTYTCYKTVPLEDGHANTTIVHQKSCITSITVPASPCTSDNRENTKMSARRDRSVEGANMRDVRAPLDMLVTTADQFVIYSVFCFADLCNDLSFFKMHDNVDKINLVVLPSDKNSFVPVEDTSVHKCRLVAIFERLSNDSEQGIIVRHRRHGVRDTLKKARANDLCNRTPSAGAAGTRYAVLSEIEIKAEETPKWGKPYKDKTKPDAGVGGEGFGADKNGGAGGALPGAGGMAGTHDPNYQTLAGVGGEGFGADKNGGAGGALPGAGGMAGTHDPNYQTLAGVGGEGFGADKNGGAGGALPGAGGMAGTHDPNYQTLAGVGGEGFGADKNGGAGGALPGAGGMAGTHDPNYQTLAGVGGEGFGADKNGGAGGALPGAGGMAGTHDPNYQTLAGVGGEGFGADKNGGAGGALPGAGGMAGTHDPNYQTLAGVGGEGFGADKNGGAGGALPGAGGMAGTHDPNYQTLAGVGGEGFGADKNGGAGGALPGAGGMAGTHDPNYQTLAGVGGEGFGADKNGGAGGALPGAGGMAGIHDPNYQTLAGVGGEGFGADKNGGSPANNRNRIRKDVFHSKTTSRSPKYFSISQDGCDTKGTGSSGSNDGETASTTPQGTGTLEAIVFLSSVLVL